MDTAVSKEQKPSGGRGRPTPPNAGKGRKKGAQNKLTKALKDMILGALNDAGGQEYLAVQAVENPAAFMVLVGKILPLQLTGADGGAIAATVEVKVPLDFDAIMQKPKRESVATTTP